MLSQRIWTLLVLGGAIYLSYLYTSSITTDESLGETSWASYVSLEELNEVRYTTVNMDKKLKAFVLGATGAVGKEVIKALAADARFEKVALIGRRPVTLEDSPNYKKFENQIVDFDKLEEYKDTFKGYDAGFCSLGAAYSKTTAQEFYKVDHDYVVNASKLAKEGGCAHMHLVSAAGANKNSMFLYVKSKGQVEEELAEMNFPKLTIYRPYVLLAKGGRDGAGVAETILVSILRPIDRARWLSVDIPLMAKVMVSNCFRETSSSVEILGNAAINGLGKQLDKGNVPPPSTSGTTGQAEDPFK